MSAVEPRRRSDALDENTLLVGPTLVTFNGGTDNDGKESWPPGEVRNGGEWILVAFDDEDREDVVFAVEDLVVAACDLTAGDAEVEP